MRKPAESNFTFSKAGSGILKVGTIVTNDADAGRTQSMSIGSGAEALGNYSIAVGPLAQGDAGGSATAVGREALAGTSSTSLGNGANASANGATAVGKGTTASTSAVAIGVTATATTTRSVAVGAETNSTHDYSVGLGYGCDSYGDHSTSVGSIALAGDRSVAIGMHAYAKSEKSIAIGHYANAPVSGMVIGVAVDNSILSGLFNSSAASTNGYLLTSTKFGINRTSAPDAMLDVTNQAATDVGAIIQGAASQSADLTQWQNSAGTTLASMGLSTANDAATMILSGTIVTNASDLSYTNPVSIGSGAYVGGNW